MEMDHLRCVSPSQERHVGGLLAPGEGSVTEKHEAHTVTANALVAKRADILFEIGELEKRIEPHRTEHVHLDAVLRMFRPDFKAEGLPVRHRRPTKSPYFAHGELPKRIFDAFRERGTTTSLEVATEPMRDKGIDPENDKPTRTDFVRRVALALGDMHRKGNAEKIGRGRAMRWKLAIA
jgi:hypothetical protein